MTMNMIRRYRYMTRPRGGRPTPLGVLNTITGTLLGRVIVTIRRKGHADTFWRGWVDLDKLIGIQRSHHEQREQDR